MRKTISDSTGSLPLPDYDSGWLAVSTSSGTITTTHNLSLTAPPKVWHLWFSPDQVRWFPVPRDGLATDLAVANASSYRNPSRIEFGVNTALITVYSGVPVYQIYLEPNWTTWTSGAYRLYIWR
jgi:hypothetical protein